MKLIVTVGTESHEFEAAEGDSLTLSHPIGGLYAEIKHADLIGRTGPCWRCDNEVSSTIEVAYLDVEGRNDCPGSDDGQPHEIDPPDGFEEG